MVGVERDAEEAAVRDHRLLRKVVGLAAVARHLTVHQLDVEVGKLDVVALRSFVASAQEQLQTILITAHLPGGSKSGKSPNLITYNFIEY